MLVQKLNAIFLQPFEGQMGGVEFSQENNRVDNREVGVARCCGVPVRMDSDCGGSVVSERRQIDEQRPPRRPQQRPMVDRVSRCQRQQEGARQHGCGGGLVGK
jgi:hypothetical protein